MTIERHYRTRELADLLACHEDTILRLAQTGQLASVYVGQERRYPESAVRAYLERHTAPARTVNAAVVPIAGRRQDGGSRTRRAR